MAAQNEKAELPEEARAKSLGLDVSEETARVLLEIGWDLGREAPAGEQNPFRRKPQS